MRSRSSSALSIGFVPLVDCAPLVVAHESGYFRDLGLRVELMREPGWASIRDKLVYGEMDGAHALAGLGFAISWGLGVVSRPFITGFLFNSHGDAITLSSELHDELGVTDAATLAAEVRHWGRERPPTFGVPHLFSSHHFILRQWLRPHGLVAGRDVQIVVLPPALMGRCMKAGYIDGYCVGEPFNTEAANDGSGIIVAESATVVPMHPEKALLVSREFAEHRADEHLALISALNRAARDCDTDAGRREAAKLLSRPEYLATDPKSILGSLFPTRKARSGGAVTSDEFHLFSKMDVNRPCGEKANWLISEMRLAGMFDEAGSGPLTPADEIFREDIFSAAVPDANNDGEKPKPARKAAASSNTAGAR